MLVTHDYECEKCEQSWEMTRDKTELDTKPPCPNNCGSTLNRIPSAARFSSDKYGSVK